MHPGLGHLSWPSVNSVVTKHYSISGSGRPQEIGELTRTDEPNRQRVNIAAEHRGWRVLHVRTLERREPRRRSLSRPMGGRSIHIRSIYPVRCELVKGWESRRPMPGGVWLYPGDGAIIVCRDPG